MTANLHDRVVRYLAASGWRAPNEVGQIGQLWRHPTTEFVLPVPDHLVDASVDWQVITERLAMLEGVKVGEIVSRLTEEAVDIANLRAANDIIVKDTIPLEAGVVLVQSCWTMLRSSATTALGPRAFIRRYRKTGDELVAAARMAHTKRGSFIIPILLPLSEPEPDDEEAIAEPAFPDMEVTAAKEPLERRVMRTFAESLAALDSLVVTPEREPQAASVHELIRAGVSHQFVSAVDRVLTEDSVAEFSAAFEWAPIGNPPKGVRDVSIPTGASRRLKSVARRLRDTPAKQSEEQFVGPIRRVERDPNDETGIVTVQTVRNGHSASIAVRVSPQVLDQAWEWARDRTTLVVQSRVRRTSDGLIAVATDAVNPLMLDVATS
ncbi:hypothetical protein FIV07_09280 [Mycobacterium sp. THAF192]|nr:hypothetical protein FIV07_09280 [Mycobacterium sp. THAF192]